MAGRTVIFTTDAIDDVSEASRWYRRQRAGLDDEFVADLDETIQAIVDRPESFPHVGAGLRSARLARFPYAAFFRLEADRIVIVGVIHGKRRPAVWRSRA